MEAILPHEKALTAYGHGLLSEIPGVVQYGPDPERRGGILSFTLEGVHRTVHARIPEVRAERVEQGISMTAIRGGVARGARRTGSPR